MRLALQIGWVSVSFVMNTPTRFKRVKKYPVSI